MYRKLAGVVLAAVLIAAAATSAPAAPPAGRQKGGGGGGGTKGVRVVGKVSAVNPATCSVTLTAGTYYHPSAVFTVVPATKVTLNGKAAQLGDLRVGDAADATFDDRSVVATSFRATQLSTPGGLSRP